MSLILGFIRRHYWWLAPLLAADIILFSWLYRRGLEQPIDTKPVVALESEGKEQGLLYVYPTAQTNLARTNDVSVYMPTASGRVESALYGSVRTVQRGGRLVASFHEGIDIAPLARDRSGRPRDSILSVADGRVVYVNRVAGNSTYGIYVVVVHSDCIGEIYTLYAHLAKVASGLKEGMDISSGSKIGRMGNTASSGIPMVRAHLHFEIGMINNMKFGGWYRRQNLVPDHGRWHGWNLTGIDPLAVFGSGEPAPRFCMRDYLDSLDPAFVLVLAVRRLPDYFERYPALWRGGDFAGHDAMVMAVSEGGVPLWGRVSTPEERKRLSSSNPVVALEVNEELLGRNGLRLIVSRNDSWVLGRNGERWLQILAWD